MDIEFAVCTDVYEAGHTCDGQPFIGERIFIAATAPDGRRWRYFVEWNGVEVSRDEEGFQHFTDVRPRGMALANGVVRYLERKDSLSPNEWYEDRPVYGSEPWEQMQAEGMMRDREEFDAGFNNW